MLWLYFILSYLVGTIMFGFLVSKVFYHKDIRLEGTGNVGARNAGRINGKKAFVMIFLGDALKGVIVVILARYLELSDYFQLIGLGLAILGHVLPITLKFKGGKGISTFIGGIIAFEPLSVPIILLGFFLFYPFLRSFTFAGLGSFLFLPILLWFRDYDRLNCVILVWIITIIFIVHADNIKERLKTIGRKK